MNPLQEKPYLTRIGRGPGKVGGDEAVTFASHFAPDAVEKNSRTSENTATMPRLSGLMAHSPPRTEPNSKVHASYTRTARHQINTRKGRVFLTHGKGEPAF